MCPRRYLLQSRTSPRVVDFQKTLPLVALLGLALNAVVGGCRPAAAPPAAPVSSATESASVDLTVVAYDAPEVARSIELLRGEWSERHGGSIRVTNAAGGAAPRAATADAAADVVIFPLAELGERVAAGALRPVRPSLRVDESYAWNDLLPAAAESVSWQQTAYALPLGTPPLMLVVPKPWYDQAQLPSPLTWGELEAAWQASSEAPPLALPREGLAPAYALLARAAAEAWSPRRPDVLFRADDMTPQIAAPPFVAALESLARTTQLLPAAADASSSWAPGCDAVLTGQALAAWGWPSLLQTNPAAAETTHQGVAYVPLPSATRTYHFGRGVWESTAGQAPQLWGAAGLAVGVPAESRNAVSAFRLAAWLTSGEAGARLSSSSPQTCWYRTSQASQAQRWWGGTYDPVAGERVQQLLTAGGGWQLPRMPGMSAYLAALSTEVVGCLEGSASAEEALQRTAQRWEALTSQLGRGSQVGAYRRHLGLESTTAER
jgi:ABC-type glycerol-3-phosphate transport system substrate-binding protein